MLKVMKGLSRRWCSLAKSLIHQSIHKVKFKHLLVGVEAIKLLLIHVAGVKVWPKWRFSVGIGLFSTLSRDQINLYSWIWGNGCVYPRNIGRRKVAMCSRLNRKGRTRHSKTEEGRGISSWHDAFTMTVAGSSRWSRGCQKACRFSNKQYTFIIQR